MIGVLDANPDLAPVKINVVLFGSARAASVELMLMKAKFGPVLEYICGVNITKNDAGGEPILVYKRSASVEWINDRGHWQRGYIAEVHEADYTVHIFGGVDSGYVTTIRARDNRLRHYRQDVWPRLASRGIVDINSNSSGSSTPSSSARDSPRNSGAGVDQLGIAPPGKFTTLGKEFSFEKVWKDNRKRVRKQQARVRIIERNTFLSEKEKQDLLDQLG